jgi:hypothetical protein
MRDIKLLKEIIILSILCWQSTPFLFGQTSKTNTLAQIPIPKSNIYWLSEAHGTASNYDIAFDLYKKVDSTVGVDYHLIESNFLQTYYLNNYIKSGNSRMLDLAFSNCVGTFAWTKEHKAYYEKIYEYEKKKPKEKRNFFVGIDIEHSYWHSHKFLIDSLLPSTISDTNKVISRIRQPLRYSIDYFKYYSQLYDDILKKEGSYRLMLGEKFDVVKYLVKNIYNITYCQNLPNNSNKIWNVTRDSLIYENFKYYNERLHFKDKVSFGLWGTGHIFQSPTKDGTTFIAAHIKNKQNEITQTGYRILYTKCSFNMPTFFVPKFARWIFGKRKYISTKAFNNDKIWSKVSGIGFFKRRKNRNLNNPLHVDSIPQNIDLVGNRKKGYKNHDYFQYIIHIKNSPACVPLKNQF